MYINEDPDQFMADCLEHGVIELYLDNDGQFVFTLGPNADDEPIIKGMFLEAFQDEIDETMVALHEKGFIDFVAGEDGEIDYVLTDEVRQALDDLKYSW